MTALDVFACRGDGDCDGWGPKVKYAEFLNMYGRKEPINDNTRHRSVFKPV